MKARVAVEKELDDIIKERDAYIQLRDGHAALHGLLLTQGARLFDESDHASLRYRYSELITECHIEFNRVRTAYGIHYEGLRKW